VLYASKCEVSAILLLVEFLSVLINSEDSVETTECVNWLSSVDFVTCQVVITNEMKSGLINIGSKWKLLSLKEFWECVTSIVRVVNFSNLYCVISEVIVNNKR